MKIKLLFFACFILITAVAGSGCSWLFLPDGEVPDSLTGQEVPEEVISQDKAEAAMCGAIVRTLVRLGHSSERTAIAFSKDSTLQRTHFVSLLTGTDMVWFCGEDSAKYLLESKISEGNWNIVLKKKDGTVLLNKALKFH